MNGIYCLRNDRLRYFNLGRLCSRVKADLLLCCNVVINRVYLIPNDFLLALLIVHARQYF